VHRRTADDRVAYDFWTLNDQVTIRNATAGRAESSRPYTVKERADADPRGAVQIQAGNHQKRPTGSRPASRAAAIIGEIREFRVGRDVVRSERSYDLALVSAFDDLAAMQHYQVHPAHQEVGALVKEFCAAVVAVDFDA